MRHPKSIFITVVLAFGAAVLVAPADPILLLFVFALIFAVALSAFLIGVANGRLDAGASISTTHQPPTKTPS